MSNNKQSSVEHFWKQLEEKGNAHIETEGVITVNITIDVNEYQLLKKQVKAMHKEEIEKAQSVAISKADMTNNRGYFDTEHYYNETFNNESTN